VKTITRIGVGLFLYCFTTERKNVHSMKSYSLPGLPSGPRGDQETTNLVPAKIFWSPNFFAVCSTGPQPLFSIWSPTFLSYLVKTSYLVPWKNRSGPRLRKKSGRPVLHQSYRIWSFDRRLFPKCAHIVVVLVNV
jgi:hypothetical protein